MDELEAYVAEVAAKMKGEPAPAKKPGRPSKYDEAVHIAAVEGCAKGGATWSQIAKACGIAESTAKLWAKEYPAFSAAVIRAKEEADDMVVNALFRRALGDYKTPPDTKACTVWLGNRRPQEWRDTSRIELTGADGGPVEHEHLEGIPTAELIAEAEAIIAAATLDSGGTPEA